MGKRGHGEGTIHFRKDRNKWRAQITLEDGRRISRHFHTRREAQRWLVEALKAKQDGLPAATPKITVAEYIDHWFNDVAISNLRPKTIQSYECIIRLHIKPILGKIRLTQLRPDHIQNLYSEKLRSGLSPRRVEFIHAVLHRALKQAVRWQLIPRNPADLVDPPRPKREPPTTFSLEQVQQFLDAAKQDRLYPLYLLAVITGMRKGEILGLRWEDVDLQKGIIQVKQTLQRVNGKLVFIQPKSQQSRRQITIPAVVVEELRKHRARQLEEKLLAGERWKESGLVFTTRVGTPIDPRNLSRNFYIILKRAGLPRIRFHDLRHTTATLLLIQGTHPKIVQELLGHSQISLTLDVYSHVIPSMQKEAIDQLSAEIIG